MTGGGWRVAIYLSVGLWLAMAGGNVALYAVRPAGHWPALETIEALQFASLIPVALVLDRLGGETGASRMVMVVGLAGIGVGLAIDLGFATGVLTFGQGILGGPAYILDWILVLAWLLAANLLALRAGIAPRGVAVLGIAAALTATLLYPVWAMRLAGAVEEP